LFPDLLDTKGFPARWDCGPAWKQEPVWAWLHILSDLAIWGAYLAIPLVLIYFLRQRKDTPFPRVFWLFGAFIFTCGTVHLIESIIFVYPVYRLSGAMKFLTAVVSWAAVLALVRVMPRALSFRSRSELEAEVRQRTQELEELNERMRAEIEHREEITRSLATNEERLRLALQAGRMGTWDWNLQTNMVIYDEMQCEIVGIGRDTGFVHASQFFDLVHPDDREKLTRTVQNCIATGEAYLAEFRVSPPGGEMRWLAGHGRIVGDAPYARRMTGVNYDISHRKQMEHALEEAHREAETANLAKSEFLANMSHEIRTPLTAILGCASVLVRDLEEPETLEMAEMIQNQGRLLLGVLNDVLDLSKIEAGRLEIRNEPTNLAAVIADVRSLMEPAAQEKGLILDMHVKSRLPQLIETDPLRLRQILINLLSNAIKFTETGVVRVECWYEPHPGDNQMVIAVQDTGIGIAPDAQQRIFEAFIQDGAGDRYATGGTGLGLTICKRLATMLGGDISLTSIPGQGSTFVVRLPLTAEESELDWIDVDAANRDAASSHPRLPVKRIPCRLLVAEDTRSIQILLRRMLSEVVSQIQIVGDGEALLAEYERASQAGEAYDLILMDMQMPILDGYSATRRLRAAGIETPIIALTASAMAGDRARCLEAGCNGYVSKPLDYQQLVAELQRWSSKPAASDCRSP
jgi:PAS domain S-box-containing protein